VEVGIADKYLPITGFKDTDYPSYYPITLPAAVVSPEDSVHYSLWENMTAKELGTMFPDGGGFLYLGPDKRPFGVALYHQMFVPLSIENSYITNIVPRHCMSRLESAYFDHTPTGHTHHCFNYIRQAIMCEANPTLEPVSPSTGKTDPRTPRVCKDWSVVRDLITQNHVKVWEDDEIWW
jgi:hypothetical protein